MWPRSSAARAPGFEPGGRWCESIRGCQFSYFRSSMYRAPRFERGGCRRKSCRECHPLPRRSPTAEALRSDRSQCRCNSCRRDHSFACVAQQQRHRSQKPDSASANLAAGTSLRNVNRTSAPGLCAKEIVPPTRGMGSMPSAFRQFPSMTLSSKRIGHPPFKRTMPGSIPARVANLITHGRVAQSAEARRRERRQCWFDSSHDHHEPEA